MCIRDRPRSQRAREPGGQSAAKTEPARASQAANQAANQAASQAAFQAAACPGSQPRPAKAI